jgi:hypothetical protein
MELSACNLSSVALTGFSLLSVLTNFTNRKLDWHLAFDKAAVKICVLRVHYLSIFLLNIVFSTISTRCYKNPCKGLQFFGRNILPVLCLLLEILSMSFVFLNNSAQNYSIIFSLKLTKYFSVLL